MEEIIQMILNNANIVVGKTNIPKPKGHPCVILYIHEDNENNFLKYSTGNSGKIVSKAEFREAYQRLLDNHNFTKLWYIDNFPIKAKNSGCNYTTIGGIFILLGIANHIRNGRYQLV